MTSEETPNEIFKRDYITLELDAKADWGSARANYRRLVNQWHPDKYTNRPREKVHAQQQFIVLTKSYDSLRGFYRSNDRLPFEIIKRPDPISSHPGQREPNEPESNQTEDTATHLDGSLLGRNPASIETKQPGNSKNSKFFFIFAAFAMMFATVAASLMLDLNENKANIEKGREALREAPASDFMPSQAEIRKSQSRGAFVQPTK